MCKSAKKVLKKIGGILRKAWNVIRKYVAYIAFIAILFFPYLWPMLAMYLPAGLVASITSLTAGTVFAAGSLKALMWRAVIGLATAYLFSSEAGDDIVDKAGSIVGSVAQGAGKVVGAGVTAVLRNPWVLLAAGGALLFLLSGRKNEAQELRITQDGVLA